jgi:hypothetical protein
MRNSRESHCKESLLPWRLGVWREIPVFVSLQPRVEMSFPSVKSAKSVVKVSWLRPFQLFYGRNPLSLNALRMQTLSPFKIHYSKFAIWQQNGAPAQTIFTFVNR